MKPVNNKSMYTHLCDQMEKHALKEIAKEDAQVQINFCKAAISMLEYERKRAETELKLKGSGISVREIESKAFDNTIPNENLSKEKSGEPSEKNEEVPKVE